MHIKSFYCLKCATELLLINRHNLGKLEKRVEGGDCNIYALSVMNVAIIRMVYSRNASH